VLDLVRVWLYLVFYLFFNIFIVTRVVRYFKGLDSSSRWIYVDIDSCFGLGLVT
jgi:hypothetical protein